jgi:hypothetical protein
VSPLHSPGASKYAVEFHRPVWTPTCDLSAQEAVSGVLGEPSQEHPIPTGVVYFHQRMKRQAYFRKSLSCVVLAGAIVCATASLWAHHSPSAIFDMSKKFTLTGTLAKVDWINPHIVVFIDAKSPSGEAEAWKFESNPPAWFKRVSVGRADFAKAIGQTVTVECVRAKDGSLYGYLQKITFVDGASLELVVGAENPQ